MSRITVADARARAAAYTENAAALTTAADTAEAAGQPDFELLDALSAQAHAELDKFDADLKA